jgi:hypothetical protein
MSAGAATVYSSETSVSTYNKTHYFNFEVQNLESTEFLFSYE